MELPAAHRADRVGPVLRGDVDDRRRAALRQLRRRRKLHDGGSFPRQPRAHHFGATDARGEDTHGAGADAVATLTPDELQADGRSEEYTSELQSLRHLV